LEIFRGIWTALMEVLQASNIGYSDPELTVKDIVIPLIEKASTHIQYSSPPP